MDRMKILSAVALLGFVALGALLFLRHDLRGWPPADRGNLQAVIKPTHPGAGTFTISDCVPGSVDPWDTPRSDEYSGTATVTVLSCRSRASAIQALLAYAAVAIFVLALLHRIGWGKR
jgi:hypothetical protein